MLRVIEAASMPPGYAAVTTPPSPSGRQGAILMTSRTIPWLLTLGLAAVPAFVSAKLPAANPTPEEKAKAAEAAAKTAWTNKVADFQLCKSMDRSAANYFEVAKKRGTAASPDPSAPACADPGAFVYTPPPDTKPLEAAGAHSPPGTASTPPSTKIPAADTAAPKK
jgi:hypothetical protein